MKTSSNFSRKKGYSICSSKSSTGGMLLLVLIVFAVALILITSAMTITLATRQHYYKEAEQQQAGLTVMSAAKLLGDAAAQGGITVTELESYADSTKTLDISSDTLLPGLSGTGGSKTEAAFAYYPSASDKKYISITVTTTLDADVAGSASQDTVVLLLKKIPHISEAFTNLITLGIEDPNPVYDTSNNIDKMVFGDLATGGTIVVHGNVNCGKAGQTFNTSVVFTGHVVFNAGTNFYGDVIFYGDNASIIGEGGSGKGLTLYTEGKNLFFLREHRASVYTSPSNIIQRVDTNACTISVNLGGIYLENAEMNTNGGLHIIRDGIVVGSNSSAVSGFTATQATIDNLTSLAADIKNNIVSSASRTILTSDQAEALFSYKLNSAATPTTPIITDSLVTSNATLVTAAQLAGTPITAAGMYYIDINTVTALTNPLTFDLTNGNISLYIIDSSKTVDKALTINSGSINFINGGADKIGKICLLDGADLNITGNGIFGSTGGAAPFLYIFGLGEITSNPNKIYVANAALQGYVGLYGPAGELTIGKQADLFCRYEGALLVRPDTAAGSTNLPFADCPVPASSQGGTIVLPSTYEIAGYLT